MYEAVRKPVDTSESTTDDKTAPDDGAPDGQERQSKGWRRWAMDTRPLRRPAFRRLWSSTIVTSVGSQLTAVAVPKQIYDITHSSAWVGYASLAGLLPLTVFALWGGAIADRMDRRKLLLLTNLGLAVTSVLFWVQAAIGLDSVLTLVVLLALQQAFFGLNSPARSASIARLVPPEELPAANALGSTVMQTGLVAGPLLAGALIPVIGLSELYLIDAWPLCVTLWAVARLPAMPPLTAAAKAITGWQSVAEGFRYISVHKVLLLSFLADIIAMVFGMPRALFPPARRPDLCALRRRPGARSALRGDPDRRRARWSDVRHVLPGPSPRPDGHRRRHRLGSGRHRPRAQHEPLGGRRLSGRRRSRRHGFHGFPRRHSAVRGDRRDARPNAGRLHGRRRRRTAPGGRAARHGRLGRRRPYGHRRWRSDGHRGHPCPGPGHPGLREYRI